MFGGGGAGATPGLVTGAEALFRRRGGRRPAEGSTDGPPWFIISIVPLNFGAEAPLKLKLHLLQAGGSFGVFGCHSSDRTLTTSLGSIQRTS